MAKQRLYQAFDEGAGGAAHEAAEAARPAERTARNRARATAEATRQQAQATGENLAGRARSMEREAEVWAEETRQRGAAAVRAQQEAVERIASGTTGQYERRIHNASRAIGHTIGRVRRLQTEDVVDAVKTYVKDHPNSVFGAVVVGFVLGRLLRR